MPSESTCGQIEKSTIPSVLSPPVGDFHPTKSSPIRGVITMLPALSPTQTVSRSDGRRSASPDSRIQWHRYRASPPDTSRTSVSRTRGTQSSSSMLGSAVSSSTPTDFQPSSVMGLSDSSADEAPGALARTDVGVPVHRGGDAEGAGVGDRLAQEVDQRVVDARVLDAGGREEKLQDASSMSAHGVSTGWPPGTHRRRTSRRRVRRCSDGSGRCPRLATGCTRARAIHGEVADRYDEWAQSYDDDLASWSYQAPAVVAETVVTRHPAAGSALDVGCGTGLVGRALRARGFAGQILGLDISQASLEIAQQCGAYDSLERADLQQRLPLEDDSVDAVVCVGVMTYLPEVEAVWREFARVARPRGTRGRDAARGPVARPRVPGRGRSATGRGRVDAAGDHGPGAVSAGGLRRDAGGRLLLPDRARPVGRQ